jgi:hypothetical protein
VPDLPRIAADGARDCIHQQLDGKAHAGASHSAIRQESGFVGGDAMGAAAIAAKIVWPRQVADGLAGFKRHRERPVGIGAAVDGDLGIERLEPAAFVGIAGEPVVMLARIGTGDEVLPAILDITERSAIFARQPGNAQLFGLEHAFVSEAAADIGRHDPHLPL